MAYKNITEIRVANDNRGHHWFEPDTMKFFKSIVYPTVYGGCYFVTSEKGPDNVRRYSVRVCNLDGSISTVSNFQEFGTAAKAKAYAKSLSKR